MLEEFEATTRIRHLDGHHIAIHPFIVAELALGSLNGGNQILRFLEMLPHVYVAQLSEVRRMIDAHALYSQGIGLVDAHLLASALFTPATTLWTLDKRLAAVADSLGVGISP